MSIARFSRDFAATTAIATPCLLVIAMVGRWLHHASPTPALLFSCVGAGLAVGIYVGGLRVSLAAIDRVAVPGTDPRSVQRTATRAWAMLLPALALLVLVVWAARRGGNETPVIVWATILLSSTSLLLSDAASRRCRWLSTYEAEPLAADEYCIATGLARSPAGWRRAIEGTLTLTEDRLVFVGESARIDLRRASLASVRRMRSPASGIVLETHAGPVRLHLADPDRWLAARWALMR